MDQNSFDARKKEVIDKLTGILIEALEKETITREIGQEIATFILDKKNNVIDENSLTSFLNELAQKWDMYKNFSAIQNKTTEIVGQDQKKLEDIKSQLTQLANSQN